jgi:hypothetical protein
VVEREKQLRAVQKLRVALVPLQLSAVYEHQTPPLTVQQLRVLSPALAVQPPGVVTQPGLSLFL